MNTEQEISQLVMNEIQKHKNFITVARKKLKEIAERQVESKSNNRKSKK